MRLLRIRGDMTVIVLIFVMHRPAARSPTTAATGVTVEASEGIRPRKTHRIVRLGRFVHEPPPCLYFIPLQTRRVHASDRPSPWRLSPPHSGVVEAVAAVDGESTESIESTDEVSQFVTRAVSRLGDFKRFGANQLQPHNMAGAELTGQFELGGSRFRWSAKRYAGTRDPGSNYRPLTARITRADGVYRELVVEFHPDDYPGQVAVSSRDLEGRLIEYTQKAIDLGWRPDSRGKPFRIEAEQRRK